MGKVKNQMESKLLVAIPSPRDIKEVTENWTTYDYDCIVVKYALQHEAYKHLREYFLEHEEYTHFCIMPDDLVVTSEQLNDLWECATIEDNYPVLSGICPVDEDETRPKGIPLAIQRVIPKQTRDSDETRSPRDWVYQKDLYPCDSIIKVEHAGFPCMIIRRDIMEIVSWRGSTKIGLNLEGNYDWQFSQDCKRNGIPIHVMPYVYLKHLRNTQSKEAKENPKNKSAFFYFINNDSQTTSIP